MTNPPGIHFVSSAEQSADEIDYEAGCCDCPKPDDRYLLAIEEGGIILTHTACGKPPHDLLGDDRELIHMAEIPVRVAIEPECDGSMWHGERRCDCGYAIAVTPDGATAVRDLHERCESDYSTVYCDLCSNHGDTTWPCATIAALDGTNNEK